MLKIGEEHVLAVQRVEQIPCFAEPVVGEPGGAVAVSGAFLGEVSVRLSPHVEQFLPLDRVFNGYDFGECPADLEEVSAGFGPGVQRQVPSQVHAHVEDAALHPIGRPRLAHQNRLEHAFPRAR